MTLMLAFSPAVSCLTTMTVYAEEESHSSTESADKGSNDKGSGSEAAKSSETHEKSAESSAKSADSSAKSAESHASNAATAESNASTAATNAASEASKAETAKGEAEKQEGTAKTEAGTAETNKGLAETAKNTAKTEEGNAKSASESAASERDKAEAVQKAADGLKKDTNDVKDLIDGVKTEIQNQTNAVTGYTDKDGKHVDGAADEVVSKADAAKTAAKEAQPKAEAAKTAAKAAAQEAQEALKTVLDNAADSAQGDQAAAKAAYDTIHEANVKADEAVQEAGAAVLKADKAVEQASQAYYLLTGSQAEYDKIAEYDKELADQLKAQREQNVQADADAVQAAQDKVTAAYATLAAAKEAYALAYDETCKTKKAELEAAKALDDSDPEKAEKVKAAEAALKDAIAKAELTANAAEVAADAAADFVTAATAAAGKADTAAATAAGKADLAKEAADDAQKAANAAKTEKGKADAAAKKAGEYADAANTEAGKALSEKEAAEGDQASAEGSLGQAQDDYAAVKDNGKTYAQLQETAKNATDRYNNLKAEREQAERTRDDNNADAWRTYENSIPETDRKTTEAWNTECTRLERIKNEAEGEVARLEAKKAELEGERKRIDEKRYYIGKLTDLAKIDSKIASVNADLNGVEILGLGFKTGAREKAEDARNDYNSYSSEQNLATLKERARLASDEYKNIAIVANAGKDAVEKAQEAENNASDTMAIENAKLMYSFQKAIDNSDSELTKACKNKYLAFEAANALEDSDPKKAEKVATAEQEFVDALEKVVEEKAAYYKQVCKDTNWYDKHTADSLDEWYKAFEFWNGGGKKEVESKFKGDANINHFLNWNFTFDNAKDNTKKLYTYANALCVDTNLTEIELDVFEAAYKATLAEKAAQKAGTSYDNAVKSKEAAANSKTAAEGSATAAGTAATNAQNSADQAKKDAYKDAKNPTGLSAEEYAEVAAQAAKAAHDYVAKATAAKQAAEAAETAAKQALEDYKAALSAVQRAEEELEALKTSTKTATEAAIKKAEIALRNARTEQGTAQSAYDTATEALAVAKNCESWLKELATAGTKDGTTTLVYEYTGDKADKLSKKDGWINWDGGKDAYKNLSNDTTIPYEVMHAYVKYMVEHGFVDHKLAMEAKTDALVDGEGKPLPKENQYAHQGISAGGPTFDASANGTLPIVYWDVDEDGKLLGTFHVGVEDSMNTGRYFVTFSLKRCPDNTFHMDGVYVQYTKPATPSTEDEGGSSRSGGTTVAPGTTPAPAQNGDVVIPDGMIPLADGSDIVGGVMNENAQGVNTGAPAGGVAGAGAPAAQGGIVINDQLSAQAATFEDEFEEIDDQKSAQTATFEEIDDQMSATADMPGEDGTPVWPWALLGVAAAGVAAYETKKKMDAKKKA